MSKIPRKSGLVAKRTKPFATVSWCAEDMMEFLPRWTVDQCCKWLEEEEDGIQLAMIDAGSQYMSELLLRNAEGWSE
jgi:hypothetical protein